LEISDLRFLYESVVKNQQSTIINESTITNQRSKIDQLEHVAPEFLARLGVNRADG